MDEEELRTLVAGLSAHGMNNAQIAERLRVIGLNVAPIDSPPPATSNMYLPDSASGGARGNGVRTFADTLRMQPGQPGVQTADSMRRSAPPEAARPDGARMGATPQRQYPHQKPWDVSGVLRTLGQGVTFGFGDEIEGVASAALGGNYEETRQRAEDDVRGYRESNPGLAVGLEIGGGVATGMGAGGALIKSGARQAGEAAMRTTGRRISTGAGLGAAAGGAAGAGSANPGSRMAGAATGALLGGTLSAGGSVAGAVTRGARRVVPGLQRIGASEEANVRILRAILNDESTPENVKAAVVAATKQGVKPEMIIDMVGPNVKGLGEIIAQTPGKGSQRITSAVRGRNQGAPGRIKRDVENALLDAPEDMPLRGMGDLAKEATDPAAHLYTAAYRSGSPFSQAELAPILERPDMRKAFASARRTLANSGRKIGNIYAPDGTLVGRPSTMLLDHMKRALDDMIESPESIARGGLGRTGNKALIDARQSLLDVMDAKVPVYAEARQRAGTRIRTENAGKRALGEQRGEKAFGQDDAGQLSEAFGQMSDPEQALYRRGATRRTHSTLDGLRTDDFAGNPNFAARVFGSENQRGQFRAIAPTEEAGETLLSNGRRESRMFETGRDVLGGSPTARRIAQMADQNDVDVLGMGSDLATGNIGGMLRRGWNTLNRRATGLTPRTQDLMADRLTRTGSNMTDYLDELGQFREGFNRRYYRGTGRKAGGVGTVAGTAGESY